MRFLWVVSLGLILLVRTVWAEPAAVRVVLLPLAVESALESRTFLQILEQRVEDLAKRPTNLVIPKADDPRLAGVDLKQPLSLEQALEVAKRFQAAYLVTLDVRFVQKVEERPQGRLLTVAARAVVGVTSVEDRRQAVVAPLVLHSDVTEGSPQSERFDEQARQLTAETARDLATAIVSETRQQAKEAP